MAHDGFHYRVGFRPSVSGWHRLSEYCTRHLISMARVCRNLLHFLPWDDRTIEPVVLKIPKAVSRDPVKLREWLASACAEIEDFYGQTSKP